MYREVRLPATKTGKCVTCGESRRRKKTFYQPLNPYTKKGEGAEETRACIMRELRAKANLWREEPIDCCKEIK